MVFPKCRISWCITSHCLIVQAHFMKVVWFCWSCAISWCISPIVWWSAVILRNSHFMTVKVHFMMVKVHFMMVKEGSFYEGRFYPWVRSGYYDISQEPLLSVIKSNMADENLTLLRLVRDAILSNVRQLDGGNVSEDMIDYLAFRLDQLYGHILRLTASNINLREVELLVCV